MNKTAHKIEGQIRDNDRKSAVLRRSSTSNSAAADRLENLCLTLSIHQEINGLRLSTRRKFWISVPAGAHVCAAGVPESQFVTHAAE